MPIRISVTTDDLPAVLEMLKSAEPDMDITVAVNEPSPRDTDEVSSSRSGPDRGNVHAASSSEATRIGREAVEKLNGMASPDDRRLLVSFIEQQIAEQGARVEPGPPDLKYVRLHLPGFRAAYCYPTMRGFVDFRLQPEDQAGYRLAFVRGGAGHGAPYSVRLRLDSLSAMEEALALASSAANRVRGTG